MKKVMSILGARPQFIKLAPLSQAFRSFFPETIEEIIVHTGQHYDPNLSKLFFDELHIPHPRYNLGIGSASQAKQTAAMLSALEDVFLEEKPGMVIVFGDTNSTLAGALAAAKAQLPLVHIEAGLRSFNRTMPEEINRVLTDHCADFLFAPTLTAQNNLINEGLMEKTYLTGDIMVDALLNHLTIAREKSRILEQLQLLPGEYILLTLHRPYNVDDPMELRKILEKLSFVEMDIIFPVHPRTLKTITENHIVTGKNIITTDPLGYLDFIQLERNACKIITDSGGIQKEAYILKIPCITIRPETEWLETLDEGWNTLLKTDSANFVETISGILKPKSQKEVFGSNVAKKMAQIIDKLS